MILISESCGRQRASLKLELWNCGLQHWFALSLHTYQCKQSRNTVLLFYKCVSPKSNISRLIDYFEFFNVYSVYDLHLLVSKFKAFG